MSERKGFNPNDTKFVGFPDTDSTVRLENATKKNVEKKGADIALLPDDAKKIEQTRRVQTDSDLREIFANRTDETVDSGVQWMFKEQPGLITEYLKKETQGSKKEEMSTKLAPGIAILGGDMALSGFGRNSELVDTGDREWDEESNRDQDERFAANKRVFDQLMQKMFGDTRPIAELEPLLQTPLNGSMGGSFESAKMGLKALKENERKALAKKNDEAMFTYQSCIDSVMSHMGDSLRSTSLAIVELASKGEIHDEEIEKFNRDILIIDKGGSVNENTSSAPVESKPIQHERQTEIREEKERKQRIERNSR